MERHPQSTAAGNASIWMLCPLISIGLLAIPTNLCAAELPNVESSDEYYYEAPTLIAESGAHAVLSDQSSVDEFSAEEPATEYPSDDLTDGECADSHHKIHSCQNSSCKCCKKGKCPGVCLDPGHPAKPKHKKPGDIDQGDCPSIRYRMSDCLRSGDPDCVYKWAKPSITDKYSAWYVGGGAWFKGRGRTAEEGTWGLDYDGAFGHARTWLNYTCGKRQGGEGAYETDHVPLKKKFR